MRKNILTVFCVMIAFTSSNLVIAQSIKLRGEIKGLGDKGLKIAYLNRSKRDTVSLNSVADKFTWSAPMAEPQKITLLIDKDRLPLYVEGSEIKLSSVLVG